MREIIGTHAPSVAGDLIKLSAGDQVRLLTDGRWLDLTVTREWRRMDGGGFGSADHGAVTVGYGPGRWNREVTADQIVKGFVRIEVTS